MPKKPDDLIARAAALTEASPSADIHRVLGELGTAQRDARARLNALNDASAGAAGEAKSAADVEALAAERSRLEMFHRASGAHMVRLMAARTEAMAREAGEQAAATISAIRAAVVAAEKAVAAANEAKAELAKLTDAAKAARQTISQSRLGQTRGVDAVLAVPAALAARAGAVLHPDLPMHPTGPKQMRERNLRELSGKLAEIYEAEAKIAAAEACGDRGEAQAWRRWLDQAQTRLASVLPAV